MVHAVDSNADSWAASTITNNLDLLCLGFQISSFLDGNPRTYYLIEVFNGLGTRKGLSVWLTCTLFWYMISAAEAVTGSRVFVRAKHRLRHALYHYLRSELLT